ncbi:hypothetical protein D9M69_491810 [compost metagenome]
MHQAVAPQQEYQPQALHQRRGQQGQHQRHPHGGLAAHATAVQAIGNGEAQHDADGRGGEAHDQAVQRGRQDSPGGEDLSIVAQADRAVLFDQAMPGDGRQRIEEEQRQARHRDADAGPQQQAVRGPGGAACRRGDGRARVGRAHAGAPARMDASLIRSPRRIGRAPHPGVRGRRATGRPRRAVPRPARARARRRASG